MKRGVYAVRTRFDVRDVISILSDELYDVKSLGGWSKMIRIYHIYLPTVSSKRASPHRGLSILE